jgi:hypothetical protein
MLLAAQSEAQRRQPASSRRERMEEHRRVEEVQTRDASGPSLGYHLPF